MLIHESFSAHQGVEDDDMNVICLGGRVVTNTVAWELVGIFSTDASAARSVTGVAWFKVAGLENRESETTGQS